MADEKSSGGWGSSIIVLAFAAASAAYVGFQQAPLVSSRPIEPEYPAHELGSRQDVDARLWQDPFAAVMREIEARREHDPKASDVGHDTAGFDHQGEKTLVLGVTLPGASYPEVAETRRRLRYAVLAALHVAGYTPADEKHIGYWRPNGDEPPTMVPQTDFRVAHGGWPEATDTAASGDGFGVNLGIGIAIRTMTRTAQSISISPASDAPLPTIVPWEEFDGEQHDHVLVLWLDEDVLASGRRPIASLVKLRSHLTLPLNSTTFALLGPEDSTMLEAMLSEASPPEAGFDVYNFGATAQESALLQKIGQSGDIRQFFEKSKVHYYRTVNTDEGLAAALACELMRRDADLGLHPQEQTSAKGKKTVCVGPPKGASNHIVLISDWDTVYGRDLSNTVKEVFKHGPTTDSNGQKEGSNDQKIDPEWIRPVSYLRGLDGRLPDRKYTRQAASSQKGGGTQQAPSDQTTANQPTAATPETTSRFESAEGQSQFDYLRRLAADLKERDAKYRREDGSHIGAVGVLGSDVYDKLLILQALRPELPEALFFTTDLDELLLPPKEPQTKSHYTRNLLVASGFGLRLNDKLQKDIPPFRNTYQTSIFLATDVAIQNELPRRTPAALSEFDNAAAEPVVAQSVGNRNGNVPEPSGAAAPSDRIKTWLAQPLLFQIGRTAPKALQPSDQAQNIVLCNPKNIFKCGSIQPDAAKLFPVLGSAASVGAACVVTILLLGAAFSIRSVREFCIKRVPNRDGVTDSVNPKIARLTAALAIVAGASFAFWWSWPWIADRLTEDGFGEPMSLFEGFSLWPSILMRAIGALLSLWLIFYTLRALKDNLQDTEQEMGLFTSSTTLGEEWGLWKKEWAEIQGDGKSYPSLGSRIMALIWFRSLPRSAGGRRRLSFQDVTSGFGAVRIARCIRALAATVVMMFGLGWILCVLCGWPNAPARGWIAGKLFFWLTLADVFFSLFLIFLVTDATLLSRAFIKRLTAVNTIWPDTTLGVFTRRFGLGDANLADWIDMQYLGRRTGCITRIVYLPFIGLAFLVVSRSELFDDFTTAWTIAIVQSISVAVVIGSAIALRLTAEKARAVACEHINAQITAAKGEEVSSGRAARLQQLLDEVKNLNDGAFAPWASQPIVKAVLLPLITFGGTWLLRVYALPGV